jgi:hypothetical protein
MTVAPPIRVRPALLCRCAGRDHPGVGSKPMSQPWHMRAGLPSVLAAGTLLLATVAALAGLVVPDLYRDTDSWAREAKATDVVTLLFAVPLLAIALWRARAGSVPARLVVIGALGYVAYSYAIFAFSVAPNAATPLYLAILGLSAWALVLGIGHMGAPSALAEVVARLPRRGSGIFLIAVPILFGLLWASEIAAAITADGPAETLARAGLPTNPIWALDLAFALPVVAYGGVRLLRDDARAAATALPALVFLVLIGLAVLGVFAFSAADGEAVVLVPVILVSVITLIAVSLSFLALRVRPVAAPELGT